jgi:hypothetical protein
MTIALVGFALLIGGALVPVMRRAFDEGHQARAELDRLPSFKAAELLEGPAQIRGRVIALDGPLTAPLSAMPCVFYQVEWWWRDVFAGFLQGPSDPRSRHEYVRPDSACRFEIDDGTGRVLVTVPPPPPEQVLCSFPPNVVLKSTLADDPPALRRFIQEHTLPGQTGGFSVKAKEGLIAEGDTISVGGHVTAKSVKEERRSAIGRHRCASSSARRLTAR